MRTPLTVAIALTAALAIPLHAQRAPFDASKLAVRADSFVLTVAGNPAGFMTESLSKEGGGYRLRNTTQMGPRMSQTTDVTLSSALALIAVKQQGQVGPNAAQMSIDVAVASGHATGSATTPGQDGMKTVTVDVALPPGAVDDNALQFLLSTIALADGAKHEVDLFSSGQGSVRRVTLLVGASESVTVPAGTFDAHRVRLEGGQAPVVFWVAALPAQRVVKVALEGSPLEFQLVK